MCSCPDPQLCIRLKRHINSHLWKIWHGNGVDKQTSDHYKAQWMARAGLIEQPLPGLIAQGVGFAVQAAKVAANGFEVASKEEQARRLAICQGCEHFRHSDGRCSKCGCGISGKAEWQAAECPIGKWKAEPILLRNHLSPGDVLAMSAAIYSLHKTHPGKYLTAVDTTAQDVWQFNPDIAPPSLGMRLVQTEYPLINQSNTRGVHFLQGYCDFLAETLGVKIPLLTNRPILYLSSQEKGWINQVQETTGKAQPFWVVNAGHKDDLTAKFWGTDNYQRVVDLCPDVLFVQIGEKHHRHPPLRGVVSLVGKTDLRQLIRLCWHAQGGLGPVTFIQHVFAAFQKPYVCLLGGREPIQWVQYPNQHTMHTMGALPCCRTHACWRSRAVAMGDGKKQDGSLCADPVGEVPRCLDLIRPEEVASKILMFREGK
jgi:ADP-heptose:LPS heptosyltransferase